jgi:hypothetical protein
LKDLPPIFEDISPDNTAAGVCRLTKMASMHTKLDGGWSLCELLPSEYDYNWMVEWAEEVKAADMRAWLHSYDTEKVEGHVYSREAMIGLLLLLFASETARRFASEGAIWAHVSKKFLSTAEPFLFVNGQPSEEHKLSIQHAVGRYRLRHAFNASEKAWMITAYLQFGFSSKSIGTRLPSWIAGLPPSEAVSTLMSSDGSDSFRALWLAFKRIRSDFRRGNEIDQKTLTTIAQSPWLLDTDRKPAVKAAIASAKIILEVGDPNLTPDGQLSLGPPHLRWDGAHTPVFNIPLYGLGELDPDIKEVDVIVNNRLSQRLTRDGSKWLGEQSVTAGSAFDEVSVEIHTPDGEESLFSAAVELWDSKVDISVFDLRTGALCNLDLALRGGGSYVFALPLEHDVTPTADHYFQAGKRRLHVFQMLPENVEIVSAGESLWSPTLQAKPSINLEDRVRIYLDPLHYSDNTFIQNLGSNALFIVRFSEDEPIELRDVHVNGIVADLSPIDEHSHMATLSVPVMPEIANKELRVSAKIVESGVVKRVLLPITPTVLSVKGLVMRDETGDRVIPPSSCLFAEQLCWIKPVFPVEEHQWRLFQDSSDKGGITPRLGSLSKVKGDAFGIGLCLENGKWNHIEGERIHLCSAVVADGGIESFGLQNGLAEIRLKARLEPDVGHQILLWTHESGISTLLNPSVDYDATTNSWSWPWKEETPIAIGIGYHGKCVHSWYSDDIGAGIHAEADGEYLAMALRWLGLPIGLDIIKRPLIERAQKDIASFVRAWVLDRVAGPLVVEINDPSWSSWNRVSRIILRDVEWPGREKTMELIAECELVPCADGFLRRFPQLFRKALVPFLTVEEKRFLLCRYAEMNDSNVASEAFIRQEMERLCGITASQFEVDPAFISNLVQVIAKSDAPKLERQNGDIAFDGSQDFCRLFALHVLRNDLRGI